MFASNPLCAPSRASILTGQYSHTTGLYDNSPSSYGSADTFHESGYERKTMATWFHAAGYRTAILGKYVNGFACRWVPPGWDVSDIGVGYFGPTLCENGTQHEYPSTTYSTTLFGSQAVDFIDGTPRSTPLFLYLTPYAPHANAPPEPKYKHLPVDPFRFWPRPNFDEANLSDKPSFIRRIPKLGAPGRWEVNWLRRRQYRTLRSVDDMIGRVIAALARRGTLGNTIIVFMSDNGQMWGSHRMTAATKRVAYDESLRLPLVVRWDGHVPAGVVARQLVGNIDVAPTLAALAGVPVPPRTDGVSFASIVERPGRARAQEPVAGAGGEPVDSQRSRVHAELLRLANAGLHVRPLRGWQRGAVQRHQGSIPALEPRPEPGLAGHARQPPHEDEIALHADPARLRLGLRPGALPRTSPGCFFVALVEILTGDGQRSTA